MKYILFVICHTNLEHELYCQTLSAVNVRSQLLCIPSCFQPYSSSQRLLLIYCLSLKTITESKMKNVCQVTNFFPDSLDYQKHGYFNFFSNFEMIFKFPEDMPAGQTPHTMVVFSHNDLVDKVQPGDRVTVTGIYRATPLRVNPRQSNVLAVYKTHFDVVHYRKMDLKRLHESKDDDGLIFLRHLDFQQLLSYICITLWEWKPNPFSLLRHFNIWINLILGSGARDLCIVLHWNLIITLILGSIVMLVL